MSGTTISTYKAANIFKLYAVGGLNNTHISKCLKVSRNTVKKYVKYYEQSDLVYTDVLRLNNKALTDVVYSVNRPPKTNDRLKILNDYFPTFHARLETADCNLKTLWEEYARIEPKGYKYSQFVFRYQKWRNDNNVAPIKRNKWRIPHIEPEDMKLLKKWRFSTDRNEWEKAVALLGLYEGKNLSEVSRKIERSTKTIKKWLIAYKERGIANIDLRRTRTTPEHIKNRMEKKSDQLISLLHEPPLLHNINRTSWSLETLSQAYEDRYGEYLSRSSASEYIRSKGYSFKKAKVVLTSPDPDYRRKLGSIKNILSKLTANEKFFSIDEFGPVSIKIRGGRSYVKNNALNTVPQFQISKGSLICTAALELSTNQVTHFYSEKKNTGEMIKLLEILLNQYKTEDRIYFSWDAASWHASKQLNAKVEEVNLREYRIAHNTPLVELAPLPASAQFLNIIESVFSGMARAVIHNSNYQTVEACKTAIDRYFTERNQAFIDNPKRAGKKIWGEELVKPIFKDSNTCKNPNCR
jgi:transposase